MTRRPVAWLLAAACSTGVPIPEADAGQAPAATRDTRAARALEEGAPDRAVTLAHAVVQAHPGNVAARVLLARAHLALGQLDLADEQLQQAARLAPRDEHVLYYLGLVTSQLARREFERLFAVAPDSARVHQLMAESLEARELRVAAEEEYQAALRADPDAYDALLGLARLQRIRLDCEHAIALYQRAERLRPSYEGAYGLGSCQLRQQDFPAALASLEQAVTRDPSAALAWVDLGSARLGAGRTSDAVAALERAIVLEPRMGEAYYMLGRVYQSTGDTARAREAYARARELRVGEEPRPEQP